MPTAWHSRDQYGNIIKNMIKTQYKNFQKTKDPKFKLKLSQNTAYLIQIENSLMNDRYNDMNHDKQLSELFEKIVEEQKDRRKLMELAQRQNDWNVMDKEQLDEIEKYHKLSLKKKQEYADKLQKEHGITV